MIKKIFYKAKKFVKTIYDTVIVLKQIKSTINKFDKENNNTNYNNDLNSNYNTNNYFEEEDNLIIDVDFKEVKK